MWDSGQCYINTLLMLSKCHARCSITWISRKIFHFYSLNVCMMVKLYQVVARTFGFFK